MDFLAGVRAPVRRSGPPRTEGLGVPGRWAARASGEAPGVPSDPVLVQGAFSSV